jgi:hypothetical protein
MVKCLAGERNGYFDPNAGAKLAVPHRNAVDDDVGAVVRLRWAIS